MSSHWQSGAIARPADAAASSEDPTLPRPEDIFLAWLMGLPQGADVRMAAAREVARLDRYAQLSAGPGRLRELLLAAADGSAA